MSIFKGAGVAIVTPMKDNLDVNYEKLEELIDFQVKEGTDCIVIAGTTGEGSTLSIEEHLDVIKAAVKFTNHRIPVVAGTGSNCTATAIQLSQEAEGSEKQDPVLMINKDKKRAAASARPLCSIVIIQCTEQEHQVRSEEHLHQHGRSGRSVWKGRG